MIKKILLLIAGVVLTMSCMATRPERYNDRMEESGIYQKADDKSVIHISGTFGYDTQMPFEFATSDKSIKHYTIIINSPGGDAYSCTSIVNRINRMKEKGIKFTTIADAKASSAGFFVWMMGDERLMRPGSLLMIHTMAGQKASDSRIIPKDSRKTVSILDANIVKQTFKALPLVDKLWLETALLYSGQTWVTGDEAMELGLATGIVK